MLFFENVASTLGSLSSSETIVNGINNVLFDFATQLTGDELCVVFSEEIHSTCSRREAHCRRERDSGEAGVCHGEAFRGH